MKYFFIKNAYLCFILFFLIFAKKQIITGEIKIVGTYLFPNVVVSTDKIDYYFDKKFFEEYSKYQGKVITLEAKIKKERFWLADKSKYFDRYIIKWVNTNFK